MIKLLSLLLIFFLEETSGQFRSTWPPWARPGEECLEYDGSKVPDCRDFIDPQIKQPFYHYHSSNCSRFWECGPSYEACLFECAHCPYPDPMCKGQQALTFDKAYQFPDGPVCDWPSNVDCINGPGDCDCLEWQTCVGGACVPQCEDDTHCPAGYECSDCKWCEGHSCSTDSECKHNMCNPPTNPHTTCEYCDATSSGCVPGCPDDSLCPADYPVCGHGGSPHLCGCNADVDCAVDEICNTDTHQCNPRPVEGCDDNSDNCLTGICDEPNDPYNDCEWCDGKVCKPGCADSSHCEGSKPICGAQGQPHRCGCDEDSDCQPSYELCDVNQNECFTPECTTDADCTPNEICDVSNIPNYLQCQYCEDFNCKPGCTDSTHCPEGYQCSNHICNINDGKTLLKSIKITSTSCTDCSTEGLKVTLEGNQAVVNKVQCTTKILDHSKEDDYDAGSSVFDDKVTLGLYNPDGGCLNAPLDGVVSDSTYEWTGTGSWEGTSLCVEWMGADNYAVTCDIVGSQTINNCQSVGALQCP